MWAFAALSHWPGWGAHARMKDWVAGVLSGPDACVVSAWNAFNPSREGHPLSLVLFPTDARLGRGNEGGRPRGLLLRGLL